VVQKPPRTPISRSGDGAPNTRITTRSSSGKKTLRNNSGGNVGSDSSVRDEREPPGSTSRQNVSNDNNARWFFETAETNVKWLRGGRATILLSSCCFIDSFCFNLNYPKWFFLRLFVESQLSSYHV
jgi:hypothetical protein